MDALTDDELGDESSPSSDASPPQDQSPPVSPPPVDSSPPSPPAEDTPDSPPPPDSTTPPNDSSFPPSGSSPAPVTPSSNGSLPVPIFSPPSPISSEAPHSPGKVPSPPKSKSSSSKHSSSSSDSKKSDSSDSSSSSLDAGVIAGVASAAVLIIAIIILCICCRRRRNKKKQIYYMDHQHPYKGEKMYYNGPSAKWHGGQNMDHVVKLSQQPGTTMMPASGAWGAPPPPNSSSPQMGGFNQSQFSYEMLAAATNGFSQENLLGQGGFGYVHKGVLPSGKKVAIKSLKSGSGQGEREFQAEVEIISRVHHRHLVSLVGYCISERQRMLVYEYVSNKTLEFHLHGKGQPVMDWGTRLKIALGSAKGLAYLHEDCHPRIIHRDIKAANILLDDNFEAMVADFGLAKLSTDNNTHVSTRVMGTFGYLAPEYASSGKLTEKSDVFSFGVMLLELITGHQPVDLTGQFMEDSLVEWARPLLASAIQDGNYDELVDKRLEGNYNPDEMARMVSCAAASVRHSARRRPKMSQIVRALEGNSSLDDLNDAGKALQGGMSSMSGTSSMSGMTSSGSSEMYDTCAYNADIMKFRKMVMSEDSSEFGATGEFGVNRSSTSS